ncbi:hypothetical protein D3C76_1668930 [compost metagenome]
MFKGSAAQAVLLGQCAVVIAQQLGYQEQRDTLGTGRGVRQPSQYQVHDIFGQVMLTAGDEDLGAAYRVAAIRLRLGTSTDDAQVSSGMRFGQAHGACPLTAVHPR